MVKSKFSFPDHNQNFWQLASIQGASQSILAVLLGGVLTKQYGSLVALASICVGNLLLWIIGFGVISMSAENRQNIIQTVQEYLGRAGSLVMVLVLTSAFIFWYTIELQVVVETLSPLLPSGLKFGAIGTVLGVAVAILSIGGIRWIKWICVCSFPFLLFFLFYILFAFGKFNINGNWGISFPAVITVVAFVFPGVVNFGTFFRHSRSRSDSILGLTLTILSFTFFELISIFVVISSPADVFGKYILSSGPMFYTSVVAIFVLLLFICVNIVNIYLASAGFEVLFPRFLIYKGYLLIGLLGSAFYFFVKNSSWLSAAEQIVDNFIVNLGMVLLVSFFVKHLVKHRPRKWEQWINCICWLIGCVATVIAQKFYPENPNRIFLSGVWTTLLSFVFVIFIEEMIYSAKVIKSATEFEE